MVRLEFSLVAVVAVSEDKDFLSDLYFRVGSACLA